MIDPIRRRALADRVQEYIAGRCSNCELERQLLEFDRAIFARSRRTDDPVISPMLERLWLLCFVHGDLEEYRLTGRYRLSDELRQETLRWVLFLRTEREYEWPEFQITAQMRRDVSVIQLFMSIGTLGIWGRSQRREFERDFNQFQSAGDYAVWPFMRRADFEESLAAACPRRSPGSLG